MKIGVLGGLLAACALGASAQTQRINDIERRCAVFVPKNWSVSQASARSSDKAASVVVISAAPSFRTLSDVRKYLVNQRYYKNDRITKDSSSELEMEGTSSSGKPNFVKAILVGERVCFAEVVYTSGSRNDMRGIIESLGPVH